MKFKTPPYDYQRRALAFLIERKGGALLMEPGTGKTKVAIDYCSHLQQATDRLRRVLVVAPLGVLGVWQDELEKHFFGGYSITRLVRRGRKRQEALAELLTNEPESPVFFLINYESCWRLIDVILRWNPQVVIADESHRIKTTGTRQSKGLHKFAALPAPPRRLILTGTAVTNSPLDIFSQWKFLKPERFGKKLWDFKYYYASWGGYGGHELLGYLHLDELSAKVACDAFIATKEECLDLPAAVDSIIRVEMNEKTQRIYKDMSEEFITFIGGEDSVVTAPIVLTKLLRLSQITGGFTKTDQGEIIELGSEKLDALSDLLESLTDRSVVVFCRFLWEVAQVTKRARKCGRTVARITGKEPVEDREESIREFKRGTINTLVCQIATAGLGIDLSVAHYAIFYSLDYSSDHYTQARDRLHRHGQNSKVTYYHLLARSSLDGGILYALRSHRKMAEIVLEKPQLLFGH